MNDQIKMQLSAFVDGELSEAESELLMRRIGRDPALREQIEEYQAIGRAMRCENAVDVGGLLGGIQAGIGDESVSVEPGGGDARPRWQRPLAGLAAAAAVAMLAVVSVSQFQPAVPDADRVDSYTVPSAELMEKIDDHFAVADRFSTSLVSFPEQAEAMDPVPVDTQDDPIVDEQEDAADE